MGILTRFVKRLISVSSNGAAGKPVKILGQVGDLGVDAAATSAQTVLGVSDVEEASVFSGMASCDQACTIRVYQGFRSKDDIELGFVYFDTFTAVAVPASAGFAQGGGVAFSIPRYGDTVKAVLLNPVAATQNFRFHLSSQT